MQLLEERAVSKINVHMNFEESQRIRGGPNAKCTYLLTNTNARQEYLCAPKFMLVLKFSACAGQKVLQQELEQQQLQKCSALTQIK